MNTINTKNIFSKYIENFKKDSEENWNYSDDFITAFYNWMKKIEELYHRSFWNWEITTEQFQENIYKMQDWFWEDNTPFNDGFFDTNKTFFEENCFWILEIYTEMQDNELAFDLNTGGNPAYYNLNFHLQNYCFDFITRDFE